MNASVRNIALVGAVFSFLAVFQAALGSHLINMNGLAGIWQTASQVHMFNAAALIGLAALLAIRDSVVLKWGVWMIVSGTAIFCGSIYVHVIIGQVFSGVAPVGGLLMMAGWVLVVLAFLRK
jgi:uncharacterized membrane protein YgdD (TMEM256/DUF423 family)